MPALSEAEGAKKRHPNWGGRRPGTACPERPDAIGAVEGAPPPAPPAKPSWGGKRAGAGAPRGNLNGFKHGRRSRQLANAAAVLAANPRIRDTLIALGNRAGREQARAEEVAVRFLANAITRGVKIENKKQARAITNLLQDLEN